MSCEHKRQKGEKTQKRKETQQSITQQTILAIGGRGVCDGGAAGDKEADALGDDDDARVGRDERGRRLLPRAGAEHRLRLDEPQRRVRLVAEHREHAPRAPPHHLGAQPLVHQRSVAHTPFCLLFVKRKEKNRKHENTATPKNRNTHKKKKGTKREKKKKKTQHNTSDG